MKKEFLKYIPIGIFLIILFAIFHYWSNISGLVGVLLSALVPFFLGLGLSFVVNIPLSFFERTIYKKIGRKGIRRFFSLVTAYLAAVLIIVLVSVLVIPRAAESIIELIDRFPGFIEDLDAFLTEKFDFPLVETLFEGSSIGEKVKGFLSEKGTGLVDYVISVTMSTVGIVVKFILAVVFSIYILSSKEKLHDGLSVIFSTYLGKERKEKIFSVFKVFSDVFHSFFVGQSTEAVILGTLTFFGMTLIRLPYAPMIAPLVGLTALVPLVGAWIGAAGGFLLILTISPIKAIIFILFLCILQFFDNYFIYPKVVGSSVGISGLWVLLGITIGGGVFGVAGMFICVPLIASIIHLVKGDLVRRGSLSPGDGRNP